MMQSDNEGNGHSQDATTGTMAAQKCSNCAAALVYAPGTTVLRCEYCGAENHIEAAGPVTTEEIDYEKFLSETNLSADRQYQAHTVACSACGAQTTLKPNLTSDQCPFCDTPLVIKNALTATVIKPSYMLPFKIDRKKAWEAFRAWIKKLWFAPTALKRYAETVEKLSGLYIPYWTYDSQTSSSYSGARGTNHTEHYTAVENGRRVNKSRTTIRWTSVSGLVSNAFDDVLVMASTSLPEKYAAKLEPWDLSNLGAFNESFLSGFRTETYQVGVRQGFEKAKGIMDTRIREAIRHDIGGDHQRINAVNTAYSDISFKHILLPIWISAYRFQDKVFRFMINGRTGEVQGERPWSWVKIALAILGAAALVTALWFGYTELQPMLNR
jgi:LSD1 subclass zinc finger protein